jgi:hypothetical protein
MNTSAVLAVRPAAGGGYATLPYLLLAGLIAAELAAMLLLNRGLPVYTLDDAYIHLALAERIWQGTYGINVHEMAAPASSILWPFLLAPFSVLPAPIFSLVPLAVNVAAASTTLALLTRQVSRALALEAEKPPGLAASLFVAGLLISTNLVPLIFTGLEHSLQQLLAVVIVAGLIEEGRSRRPPVSLWVALIAIPLIRYDSLALAVPALAYLFWRRHFKGTAGVTLVLGLALGGFSLALARHGLGLLPASLLARSDVVRTGGGLQALLLNLYGNVLPYPQGNVMLLSLAGVLAAACERSRAAPERGLASVLCCALVLHLLFGKVGSYFRYEAYVWTATLVGLLYLYREPLARVLVPGGRAPARIALFGALTAGSLGYLFALASTPLASNNIYDQQYQMHRFVTDYTHGPVAVNDLGWVSFGNPSYVLDLAGLASPEALEARYHARGSGWIDRLCRVHGVQLVMIYDDWFATLPPGWVHLGTLSFARARITPADRNVQFYATNPDAATVLRSQLEAFRQTLPARADFRFAQTR